MAGSGLECGECSFVPLDMSIAFKNWELAVHLACNYPCSLTSPRKLTKLHPGIAWWETAKPTRWGDFLKQEAFPLGGARTMYAVHCVSVYICIKAANTTVLT